MRATNAFLTSHLTTKHGINNTKKEKESSSISTKECNTVASLFQKQNEPKFVNDTEKNLFLKEKIIEWVIKDFQALNVVESASYRDMMKTAWPAFKPFTNREVKRMILEKARHVRKELRNKIGGNTVALTCDHWTSAANDNYEGMTVHWISEDWMLHSVPVGCFLHTGDSTSLSLVDEFFRRIFFDLGLTSVNIVAIVNDTTSNQNKFGMLMKSRHLLDNVYCTDHVLQLSAKIAYTENGADVLPLMKCRELVKYFKQSSQATAVLKAKQRNMNQYSLYFW
jgi:hypothetical protein